MGFCKSNILVKWQKTKSQVSYKEVDLENMLLAFLILDKYILAMAKKVIKFDKKSNLNSFVSPILKY